MTMSGKPAAPRNSAGPAPLRRPGSIRRTSSIDTVWPDGRAGHMAMVGRARDAVTLQAGDAPLICAEDEFRARVDWGRTILDIDTSPERPGAKGLVGARGGGLLRGKLDQVLPQERREATPLHLLLDDISGASLVAGWAWSQWMKDWRRAFAAPGEAKEGASQAGPPRRNMEGVCIGFQTGSSALTGTTEQSSAEVVDLRHPEDPDGWHAFTAQEGVGMRRARRIDVWMDEVIHIDSAFQDSATNPQGGRTAVHEYRLTATVDPASLRLLTVTPEPRVLPYSECPSASINAQRLVGAPLAELREQVLVELRGVAGCTHLNDALRALAEAPMLLERLKAAASVTA